MSEADNISAVWQTVTNTAFLPSGTNEFATNWTGHSFVPKTPETFGYDADGNQTNDGRWTLTWDGENRLIQMQNLSGAPIGSSNRVTFIYDQQGRRVSKATEIFTNGAWSITLSNRFVYDGWNLVAELNATNNAVVNSFAWGLDLSGSLQGAGGVSGLLMMNATNAGSHFCGHDGNGNVAILVNATNGAASANYEYDPFGQVLRATGPMALLNPFRFSTKYTDGENGFNYYGYRFYNAVLGRWVNRDPIGEWGGVPLHTAMKNDSVNSIDKLGLVGMGEYYMHCCHLVWDDKTHCCCRGYAISRSAADTGIRRERWDGSQPVPNQGTPYHVWLTWDGGSVDNNAIIGMYAVSSPAAGETLYNGPNSGGTRSTTKIMLSKCEYDFDKLNACLSKKAAAAKAAGSSPLLCDVFVDKMLSECKEESKGCTSK